MRSRREHDSRTNEQFCQGLRNMGLTMADEAADRIDRLTVEQDEARRIAAAWRSAWRVAVGRGTEADVNYTAPVTFPWEAEGRHG